MSIFAKTKGFFIDFFFLQFIQAFFENTGELRVVLCEYFTLDTRFESKDKTIANESRSQCS